MVLWDNFADLWKRGEIMSTTQTTHRDEILASVSRVLFSERSDPFHRAAQRALLIYAQANELIAYADFHNDDPQLDADSARLDGTRARALALATLDELNEATPFQFMPFPIDDGDRLDSEQLLHYANANLDQAHEFCDRHNVVVSVNAPIDPRPAYAQFLADVLGRRKQLYWPGQQSPA